MSGTSIMWACRKCGFKHESMPDTLGVDHNCPLTHRYERFDKIVPAADAASSPVSPAGTLSATSPKADHHEPGAAPSSRVAPGSSDGTT